jgi:hypothetical protein
MPSTRTPAVALTALAAAACLTVAGVAGCGSSASAVKNKVTSTVSSAVSSASSEIESGISSASSEASSAVSSVLSSVSGAIDADSDVALGTVTSTSDGKATVQLTVTNPTADVHDYTVSVSFEDGDGSLEDAVVVSVDNVPANGKATATATSNRKLTGTVKAEVSSAVRH